MSTLRTPLCDLLNIEVPILQAGMGLIAYSDLAAAVANAGGLGCLGGIDMSVAEVDHHIKRFRRLGDKPLALDLGFPENAPSVRTDVVLPDPLPQPIQTLRAELAEIGVKVKDDVPDQAISREDNLEKLDLALDQGVEVIVCGLGTPVEVVERCHSKGVTVMSIVGTARAAQKVINNGTDVVVIQGTEGGGHTGDVGTLTLLGEVLDFSTVPVVAAGGITTGDQVAACLVAGAQGAWIGTRFIATAEAGCQDVYKGAIVKAGYNATLRTPRFDGLHVRQLRNRFTDVWDGHEHEMQGYPVQRMLTIPIRDAAAKASVASHMNLAAGAGVGLINDLPSAGDLVKRLTDETVAAIKRSVEQIQFA
ncbi:NAD(P)H-dependent flavin oxidoreductase [Streptomyces sp. NPDC048425]|uniref:NAD(P)H-dependent flavin oxidoreductase n=1 Tax=Streptomyces sp. NPDC048425 TaxID=3365548 RepID=UPI0037132865